MAENYEHIYRAIITLNNTGVFLIDHAFYAGAIETLKDSMSFMKELVQIRNDSEIRGEVLTSSTSTCTASRSKYDAALQAAWRRKSMLHHRINIEVAMNRVNVSVISELNHPRSVYDQLVQQQPQEQQRASSLCCVTIDQLPFDNDESNFDRLQRESALILYNLSIAYRCFAKQPMTIPSTMSTDYNQISFQLLECAYAILCSVLQNVSAGGDLLMNVSLNLFSLTLVILSNLYEMSNKICFRHSDNRYGQFNMAYEYIVTALVERFMHTAEEEIQMYIGAAAA